jgi:hypothetical protein
VPPLERTNVAGTLGRLAGRLGRGAAAFRVQGLGSKGRGAAACAQDVEKGVKEFAQNVEQLVERVVSGEMALELTQNMDKYVSGFIRHFEDNYSKFERALVNLTLQRGMRTRSAAKKRIAAK